MNLYKQTRKKLEQIEINSKLQFKRSRPTFIWKLHAYLLRKTRKFRNMVPYLFGREQDRNHIVPVKCYHSDLKMVVLCVVTLCRLVQIYRPFTDVYCLNFYKIQGAAARKTLSFILPTVRIWNITMQGAFCLFENENPWSIKEKQLLYLLYVGGLDLIELDASEWKAKSATTFNYKAVSWSYRHVICVNGSCIKEFRGTSTKNYPMLQNPRDLNFFLPSSLMARFIFNFGLDNKASSRTLRCYGLSKTSFWSVPYTSPHPSAAPPPPHPPDLVLTVP